MWNSECITHSECGTLNGELKLGNSLSLATHSELGTFIWVSELRPQNRELKIWNLECGTHSKCETHSELGTQSEL